MITFVLEVYGGAYEDVYSDIRYAGESFNALIDAIRHNPPYVTDKWAGGTVGIIVSIWKDGKNIKSFEYDYMSMQDMDKAIERLTHGVN